MRGSIGVLFDSMKAGLINREDALGILNKFGENPQIYWIDPDIIKSTTEKLNLKRL